MEALDNTANTEVPSVEASKRKSRKPVGIYIITIAKRALKVLFIVSQTLKGDTSELLRLQIQIKVMINHALNQI